MRVMTEEEVNLRNDIRGVVVDIHDNFYEDPDHFFNVLTEYIVSMLRLSTEIVTRINLQQPPT